MSGLTLVSGLSTLSRLPGSSGRHAVITVRAIIQQTERYKRPKVAGVDTDNTNAQKGTTPGQYNSVDFVLANFNFFFQFLLVTCALIFLIGM